MYFQKVKRNKSVRTTNRIKNPDIEDMDALVAHNRLCAFKRAGPKADFQSEGAMREVASQVQTSTNHSTTATRTSTAFEQFACCDDRVASTNSRLSLLCFSSSKWKLIHPVQTSHKTTRSQRISKAEPAGKRKNADEEANTFYPVR